MSIAAGVGSFGVLDIVYFKQAGLSLAAIGLMMLCFNSAVTVAELPFALLFDRHSTKLSLYIGFSIRICAFILFALNWGFSFLLLAQALAGIATAAASGTTTALVLNEVKEQSYKNMSIEKVSLRFFRV
ncbi:MFS transporter [Candidatus Tokpelaia sp.]|uniref:MFS transporter n=1 Tax=Candidatus Tokpelaia sp. TaxID=2233777 RepID=UPI00123BA616|nr:MFS transporter [Candidatus Tokpelaia sp.]